MADEVPLAERLRAGYSVWNETGDISGILAELDPDAELVVPDAGPEGAMVFRGHDGIAKWAQGLGDAWRHVKFEPVEVESDPSGRRALVMVKVITRGRASDLYLEGTEAHVLTLGPSGKIARLVGFNDLDRARAAFEAEDTGLS
jgi:ketosteroid isomerase-like protein